MYRGPEGPAGGNLAVEGTPEDSLGEDSLAAAPEWAGRRDKVPVVWVGRGTGDKVPVAEGDIRRIGQEGTYSFRGRRQGGQRGQKGQRVVPGLGGRGS